MGDWISRTMLIERFTGVFVYALLLMIVYQALRDMKNPKSLNRILNVYLVVLTVMGFYFIPESSTDVYRWLRMTKSWQHMSFSSFYDSELSRSATPASYLMIYLCRQTGVDGVLPAVCSFLFHWNIFSIIKMLHKKHDYAPKDLALALLLFMSMGRFLEAISGVRAFVAISILARCFCDELLNEKNLIRNIVWELLAALMHPLATVLLGIRLAYLCVQKTQVRYKRIVNLAVSAVALGLAFVYGAEYIEYAMDKAEGYLAGDMYSYTWEYIIGGIMYAVQAYLLYHAYKVNRADKSVPYRNLIIFNAALMLIELVFCYEYSIFHRIHTFSSMTMLPVIVYVLKHKPSRGNRMLIYYTSLVVLLLAGARGDLCAYKFFLLS